MEWKYKHIRACRFRHSAQHSRIYNTEFFELKYMENIFKTQSEAIKEERKNWYKI